MKVVAAPKAAKIITRPNALKLIAKLNQAAAQDYLSLPGGPARAATSSSPSPWNAPWTTATRDRAGRRGTKVQVLATPGHTWDIAELLRPGQTHPARLRGGGHQRAGRLHRQRVPGELRRLRGEPAPPGRAGGGGCSAPATTRCTPARRPRSTSPRHGLGRAVQGLGAAPAGPGRGRPGAGGGAGAHGEVRPPLPAPSSPCPPTCSTCRPGWPPWRARRVTRFS